MIPEIVPLYEGIAFQRVHKVGRNINPDNMPILPPNTQQKRAGLTIKEEKKRSAQQIVAAEKSNK